MSAQRRAGRSAAATAKAKRERELRGKREQAEAHLARLREGEAQIRQAFALNATAQQQLTGRLRFIMEELGEVPPMEDPPAPEPLEEPPPPPPDEE